MFYLLSKVKLNKQNINKYTILYIYVVLTGDGHAVVGAQRRAVARPVHGGQRVAVHLARQVDLRARRHARARAHQARAHRHCAHTHTRI